MENPNFAKQYLDNLPDAERVNFHHLQKHILDEFKVLHGSGWRVPDSLLKGLKQLSIIGVAISFSLAANEAEAAEKAGDTERAKEIMIEWGVGELGSEIASMVAGVALGLAGGAILSLSAPVAIVAGLAVGIAAGIWGEEAGKDLYKLTKDLDGNGKADIFDRMGELYFGKEFNINDIPEKLRNNVSILNANLSAEDLANLAKTDIAYRYALVKLNPFVFKEGIDYEKLNENGELDLYSKDNPNGLTETYLEKRAEMLKVIISSYLKDEYSGHPAFFDYDSEKLIGANINNSAIIFGSDKSDNDISALRASSLGNGNDFLFGGGGNDTLKGELGNDYMEGGKDFDTYHIKHHDTIFDSDGRGRIIFDDADVQPSVFKRSGGVWLQKDGAGNVLYTAKQQGSDLVITPNQDKSHKATIKDFFVVAKHSEDGIYHALSITLKQKDDSNDGDNDGDSGRNHTKMPPPAPPLPPPPSRDPLVLDLDGDGKIGTLSKEHGVHFDLDNSGFAEKTAWVEGNDGILVWDKNNNGHIDGGYELFGTETLLKDNTLAPNGYVALAEHDENGDGIISQADNIYKDLKIWRDKNQNGLAEQDELYTLSDLKIKFIDTTYTTKRHIDDNRVEHRENSQFGYTDGRTGLSETLWFSSDTVNSVPVTIHQGTIIAIDDDIKDLPNVVGFGNVHSLHHTMQLDKTGALKKLVERFVSLNTDKVESSEKILLALTHDIILYWTGQQVVDKNIYGDKFNSQHIAVMEKIWGQLPIDTSIATQLATVIPIYDKFANYVYTMLMAQSHFADVYNKMNFYQNENGKWTTDFEPINQYIITQLRNGKDYKQITESIEKFVNGLNPYTIDMINSFKSSLNTYKKNKGIIANDGNTMKGDEHDNEIYGSSENDYIDGGLGNDIMIGHAGNDTYVVDSPYDVIIDEQGDNKIIIQSKDGYEILDTNSIKEIRIDKEVIGQVIANNQDNIIFAKNQNANINAKEGNNNIKVEHNGQIYVDNGNNEITINKDGKVYAKNGNNNITVQDNAQIYVNDGNNKIFVNKNSQIYANNGNNSISLGLGNHNLVLADGNNDIKSLHQHSSSRSNYKTDININLGQGDNIISTKNIGNQYIVAKDGNNNLTLEEYDIDNRYKNNKIKQEEHNYSIIVGDGNNRIESKLILGKNTIKTGNGNNNISIKGGRYDLFIGDGNNKINIEKSPMSDKIDINHKNNIQIGNGDNNIDSSLDGSVILTTGNGNNTLKFRKGDHIINTGNGNNKITAEDGDHSIKLGDGDDNVTVGKGRHNIILGNGNNKVITNGDDGILQGGNHQDTFTTHGNRNTLIGGEGYDIYHLSGAANTIINDQDGIIHIDSNLSYIPWWDWGTSNQTGNNGMSLDKSHELSKYGELIKTEDKVGHYYFSNKHQRFGDFVYNDKDKTLTYKITNWEYPKSPYKNSKHENYFTLINFDINNLDLFNKLHINANQVNLALSSSHNVYHNTKFTLRDFVSQGDFISKHSDGDDVIYGIGGGGFGKQTIYALAGNDKIYLDNNNIETIQGWHGSILKKSNDAVVYAGTGDDTIISTGASPHIIINGDEGNDHIEASFGSVSGGDGNDMIHIDYGTATGNAGNDIITIYRGTARGGDGDDILTAINKPTTTHTSLYKYTPAKLIGGLGNDILNGNIDDNHLEGEEGNDTLYGNEGHDTLYGNEGDDRLYGNEGDDFLYGGEGNDILEGNEGHDTLYGNEGDDILIGGDGNDWLEGGEGADTLIGGLGDDVYIVDEFDTYLEEGEDLEGGYDTIHIASDFDLSSNNFEAVTLLGSGNFNVIGDEFDNQIIGNVGNNHLMGGAGNDTLDGGDGDDVLDGGIGADTLIGGNGNDYYILDNEFDSVVEWFDGGIDTVEQHTDRPFYDYDAFGNTINSGSYHQLFDHVENLILKGTTTTAFGNNLDNIIILNEHNNFVNALAGNDTIIYQKGGGKDTISSTDSIDSKDTLVIEGYDLSEASFVRVTNTASPYDMLQIRFKSNPQDTITLLDYFAPTQYEPNTMPNEHGEWVTTMVEQDNRIDEIIFKKGDVVTTLSQSEFETHILAQSNNTPPHVNKYPKPIKSEAGKTLHIQLDKDTIKDIDPYDNELTYKITLASQDTNGNYEPIPEWLSFDPATLTLTGTPPENTKGNLQFILWGEDSFNYSAGAYVNLVITTPQVNLPTHSSTSEDETLIQDSKGNDTLKGNSKDTTFVYTGGKDTIIDTGGIDTLVFGNGITFNEVGQYLMMSGNDLVLRVNGSTTNQVTLKNYFAGANSIIETIKFETGGEIDYKKIYSLFGKAIPTLVTPIPATEDATPSTPTANSQNNFIGTDKADKLIGTDGNDQLQGLAGADTLTGKAGHDILIGGAGNDTLMGGTGNDLYYFTKGFGKDTIVNTGGGYDNIYFDGISFNQVGSGLTKMGNDLILKVKGSTDELTLKDFFLGGDNADLNISFADGGSISNTQLLNLFGSNKTATHTDNQGFNESLEIALGLMEAFKGLETDNNNGGVI